MEVLPYTSEEPRFPPVNTKEKGENQQVKALLILEKNTNKWKFAFLIY